MMTRIRIASIIASLAVINQRCLGTTLAPVPTNSTVLSTQSIELVSTTSPWPMCNLNPGDGVVDCSRLSIYSDISDSVGEWLLGTGNTTEPVWDGTNGTFHALDFSNNQIGAIEVGAFQGIDSFVVDLSNNRIARIESYTFTDLSAHFLDLHENSISYIGTNAFENCSVSVLNLARNIIRTINTRTFASLHDVALSLEDNMINNVLREAWADSELSELHMRGNPTQCFIPPGQAVTCQCAHTGEFSNYCIHCPSTIEFPEVEWRGIFPEDVNISESIYGLDALVNHSVEVTSLIFTCGVGAVEGQECIVECRDGFSGTPNVYTCGSDGEWDIGENSSLLCIIYNGPDLINITNATDDLAITPATAGSPFLYPGPRAYGTNMHFNSFGLPRGVLMDKNGQLYGIPTESGNYSVTIYAVDNFGELIPAAAFLLVVTPPLSTFERQESVLYIGDRVEYGTSLEVVGGQPPFKFNYSGTLPPGLRLHDLNDRPFVTGVPYMLGSFRVVLKVTDNANHTASFPSVTFVVRERDSLSDFKVQFAIAAGLAAVAVIASIYYINRYKRRLVENRGKRKKVDNFELSDLDANSTGAFEVSVERTKAGKGPRMRTMILSHLDSIKEQAADLANEEPSLLPAASIISDHRHGAISKGEDGDSLRSGSSQHSISSQIGRTGYEKCCVGTRIYRRDSTVSLDENTLIPLEMFLAKASYYSKRILIAAPLDDQKLCEGIEDLLRRCSASAQAGQDFSETELVKIPYWGKFTPPLNILLRHATLNHNKWLLFQSVEILAEQKAVTSLLSQMDDNTLVAGLALEQSHNFVKGRQPLTGLTCPWNTFAVWNVEKLGRTGFLPISDGVPPLSPDAAGVEEVIAIALAQMLFPKSTEAKLVQLDSDLYTWDIDFKCAARLKAHKKKMISKLDRPKRQMLAMGDIQQGSTLHIDMTKKSKRTKISPLSMTSNEGGYIEVEGILKEQSGDAHEIVPLLLDQRLATPSDFCSTQEPSGTDTELSADELGSPIDPVSFELIETTSV